MKLRKLLEFYIYLTVLFLTELLLTNNAHCMKSVQTQGFSDPYFPAFGPEKKSVYGDFSHSGRYFVSNLYSILYAFPGFSYISYFCKFFNILFSYEEKDIGRSSNLH